MRSSTVFHRMEDYFDPRRSLRDRLEELSDPTEFSNHENPRVNTAVMGLVVKFLCDYLQILETNVNAIQDQVRLKVGRLEKEDMPMVSRHAFQMTTEGITDAFGVQCLSDIRVTAALLKEIMFNNSFKRNDQFLGVDFGSGTGILSAAMLIAARRNFCREITLVLVDSQYNSLQHSTRVLDGLGGINTQHLHADLRDDRLYEIFAPPLLPNFCVSETIGHTTPAILHASHKGIKWREGEISRVINGAIDPYMDVLDGLMRFSPNFYHRVLSGEAALFPNPINGDFIPDNHKTRLLLRTGPTQEHIPLDSIRNEFMSFEDFSLPTLRWS